MSVGARTVIRLGGQSFRVRPELFEDFTKLDRWRQCESHGLWEPAAGPGRRGLRAEWLTGSPSLFLAEPVEGDFLMTLSAARLAPGPEFIERFRASRHVKEGEDPLTKYNFNFWLRAASPDGGDFLAEYPARLNSGSNGMGDDHWRSYYTTVVRNGETNWVRLRRSPGYVKAAEAVGVIPQLPYGRSFELAFAIRDGRVRMWFDGKPVYDYAEAEPGLYARGHVGLCVWLCVMLFENLAIYRFAD